MFKGLPEFCYVTRPSNGETVKVIKGKTGYVKEQTQLPARELNELIGVTIQQEQAMLTGAMGGWDSNGANPEAYDNEGRFLNK